VEALYQQFPEADLKLAIGGQISIEVFPVGWNETFCLQFLEKAGFKTIHFFGDKTAPVIQLV
jgi:phosphomannomutase